MAGTMAVAALGGASDARAQTPRYGLIGKMLAQPGKRDELIGHLLAGTGAMPGCLSYVVARDATDADAIWITEVWDGRDSHAASLKLPELTEQWPEWAVPFRELAPGMIGYHWPVVAVCGGASLVLLWWLHRLPYLATKEEQLSDARARQPHRPLASAPANVE